MKKINIKSITSQEKIFLASEFCLAAALMLANMAFAQKLMLAVWLAFLPLLFFRPLWFLSVFFAVTPAIRNYSTETLFSLAGADINFNAILIASLILFGVITLARRWPAAAIFRQEKTVLLFFVFMAFALASLFYSADLPAGREELARALSVLAVFLSSLVVIKSEKERRILFLSMLFGALIPATVALWQFGAGGGWYDASIGQARIFGTLIHPATFSFYLLFLLPTSAAFFQNSAGRKKMFFVGVSALFIFLIITSLTRGAWFALAAMALVYGLARNRKMIVVGLAVFLLFYAFSTNFSQRLNDVFNPKYNSSFLTRINIAKRVAPAFFEAPFFGHGFASFASINLRYNEEARFYESLLAHNDYLRLAVELGLAGLAAYLLLFIFLFKKILALYRREDNPKLKNHLFNFLILVIGAAVVSAGDNLLRTAPVEYVFWAYAGAMIGSAYHSNNKNPLS